MKVTLKRFTVFFLLAMIGLSSITNEVHLSAQAFYPDYFAANRMLFSMSYEEKLKKAEEEKDDLERKKKETEKNLEKLRTEQKNLILKIEEHDQMMMDNDLELEKRIQRIEETEEELEKNRILLEETRELEKKQYETMCTRIQYMYENGNTSMLDIILNSGSLSELLNQAEYFNKMTEYDNNLLNSYIETKQQAEETELMLELDLASLNILRKDAEDTREVLLGLIEEKSILMEKYTAKMGIAEDHLEVYLEEIVSAEMSIDEMKTAEAERVRIETEKARKAEEEARRQREKEEKERQQALINANNNAASNIDKTDTTSAGDMIWPLPGDGRVFSGFGPRVAPTVGASTFHQGVDIGGEYGANIVSALAGTVTSVGYNATSGNYVRIDHGNGYQTSYLHCSKQLVAVGEYVQQGQIIAKVGSTGVSTGPHLHFSVSVNGTYVDPMNYISY